MKKIFSIFAAVLFAGSMMAGGFDHGLYVPANATVEAASEVGTTASVDATTGDLTINIAGPHTNWGDWGNQIKLSTGITALDPTKSYEIGFKAVASTDDCPASHLKIFDDSELFHSTTEKYTTTETNFSIIVSGTATTNGIIVWSFTWAPAQTVTISDIYVRESAVTYSSLADVYTMAKDDKVTLKAFEVVYVNGSNIYVKDATASGLIYAYNYGLVAGDKVDLGLEGTVDIYNGIYEVKPTTAKDDLTVTPGTPAGPAVAAAAPTAADQNKYVVYKNVTVEADAAFVLDNKNTVVASFLGENVTFYNNFKIAAELKAGKSYNIVGVNAMYKENVQVYPISVEEVIPMEDECAGEHGLYDPEKAVLNGTYFGPGWNQDAGADYSATIENGNIIMHVGANAPGEMWNAQLFVDPGFTFTPGKAYHYELDVESAGKVCITVKVNDSDDDAWFVETIYDQNIGGGSFHFETDEVYVNENLKEGHGPLVFGFGWTDANQDVIIKCIKIVEIGDAPKPKDDVMYIKHPWGTGANEDWTWQTMEVSEYSNTKAYAYVGLWGGVGFNIADNEEGNDAKWFAADVIGFRNAEGLVLEAPALGTEATFYYVPAFDVAGAIVPATYVVYEEAEQGIENVEAVKAVKVIRNGQLVIVREGVEYNALGAQL